METKKTATGLNRKAIQFLLQGGLIVSIVLMFLGVVLNIYGGHVQILNLGFSDLFSSTTAVADRFLVWGIFILALTPVFRVIALLFLWMKERDWKFVAVAFFVLITLSISIFRKH